MLQSFQENKNPDPQISFYQTQFGLFKITLYCKSIVAAEFIDASKPVASIKTIELDGNSFKEYSLNPIGSPFQKKVWQAVSKIPYGKTMSYLDVAFSMKRQSSVRAVATAIGYNPIAYLIPCHRVIRSNGDLGGYRWGVDLKQQLLEWETNNQ